MVTRYTDKGYFTFTANSASDQGLEVKCPQCGKLAIVKMADGEASCSCTHCNFRQKKVWYATIWAYQRNEKRIHPLVSVLLYPKQFYIVKT